MAQISRGAKACDCEGYVVKRKQLHTNLNNLFLKPYGHIDPVKFTFVILKGCLKMFVSL